MRLVFLVLVVATWRPALAQSNSDTVGTAYAPTTPGGKCLGQQDYSAWTSKTVQYNGGLVDGFTIWPTDLQNCAQYCVPASGTSSQFLGKPLTITYCVSECMNHSAALLDQATAQMTPITLYGPAYSLPCAECMGNVTSCSVHECIGTCILGKTSEACDNCTTAFCDDAFQQCAGLNPYLPVAPAPPNPIIILVAALVPSVVVLVICIYCGWLRYQRNLAKRAMNMDDLAKLAGAGVATPMQQMPQMSQVAAANPGYGGQGYSPPQYSQTKFSPPPPAPGAVPGQVLTPYQLEYQRQQAALAQGMPIPSQRYKAPSQRMSQMVRSMSTTPAISTANARKLIVKFDFVGENSDELTVPVGQELMGLEEADDWWLAKVVETGVIRLIPSVFVEVASTMRSPMLSQTAPQF